MHTREKLMELAVGERDRLKEKMNESMESSESGTVGTGLTSCREDGMGRDHIEIEKRRLEKVAKRQQKELLRMLVSGKSSVMCVT